MNQYYLIAQLPSLDCVNETTLPPITEERFYELCDRYLGKKASNALKRLTLVPEREGKKDGCRFIDRWNEGERKLRLALAGARAEKMKKSFDGKAVSEESLSKDLLSGELFSEELLSKVKKAVETEDPLEAEKYLTRLRLEFLETLRPADPFSENMLFYYALKLKLIFRIRKFDENAGKDAYRNIYDSIICGDGQEVRE